MPACWHESALSYIAGTCSKMFWLPVQVDREHLTILKDTRIQVCLLGVLKQGAFMFLRARHMAHGLVQALQRCAARCRMATMRSGSRSMWQAWWVRKLRGETLRRCASIPSEKQPESSVSMTTLLHLRIVYTWLPPLRTLRPVEANYVVK